MRHRAPLALVLLVAAFCGAADKVAASPVDDAVVDVSGAPNALGETSFLIESPEPVIARVVVWRAAHLLLDQTIDSADPATSEPGDGTIVYRWSCRRTGVHRYVVYLSDALGGTRAVPGRFRVLSCATRYRGTLVDYDGNRSPRPGQGGFHGLYFEDAWGRDTTYRVCIRGGVGRIRRCYRRYTDAGGSTVNASLLINDRGGPGRYLVAWYVGRRVVDRLTFYLRPEGV